MNAATTKTSNPRIGKESVEGVVIGLEMTDWAGFNSGRILVTTDAGNRIEFRYGKDSTGDLPSIGDYVDIEYSGKMLLEISEIRISSAQRVTTSDRVSKRATGLNLIAGRPKGAAIFTISQILVAIALCIAGWITGITKHAAPYILGFVASFQICLAWLVWEHTAE